MLNENKLKISIGITLLINVVVVFFSILPDHDPALYADIAKTMVLAHDWTNLFFNHLDWLDKPHFPFWITALSFKLFGISSFSYILPGFLFHLIGVYYTYLLTCYLFNKSVGLLAVLFYVTAAHLMISSIDVRAEAYLLGEIMPACYYWLRFHGQRTIKFNYVFLGAFFTALAMMTKGIFVLVTIFGGFIVLWFYQPIALHHQVNIRPKRVAKLSLKWSIALALSFVLIAPELVSLYLQFDAHPEKIIFDHTNVSGIKWFFWDSQVGRFFNTGPISGHYHPFHYLFFIYTFLWSFLPWSIIFVAALYGMIKALCLKDSNVDLQRRRAYIYLLGAFFPTFILFSASTFQLDHYTNIIIPFAAIMCASWVYDVTHGKFNDRTISVTGRPVFNLQIILTGVLIFLLLLLDVFISAHFLIAIIILILGLLAIVLLLISKSNIVRITVCSALAINLIFVVFMIANHDNSVEYDAGYNVIQYLKQQPQLPIVEYRENSATLAFHSKDHPIVVESIAQLRAQPTPYYLVIKKDEFPEIKQYLGDYQILFETKGVHFINNTLKIIINSWSKLGLEPKLTHYLVIRND